MRCVVDKRTGFVAGMRYGYGPIGDVNICSQGNSFQASWDMSPTSYRPAIACNAGGTFLGLNTTGAPTWGSTSGGSGLIDPELLLPYGALISQVGCVHCPCPIFVLCAFSLHFRGVLGGLASSLLM